MQKNILILLLSVSTIVMAVVALQKHRQVLKIQDNASKGIVVEEEAGDTAPGMGEYRKGAWLQTEQRGVKEKTDYVSEIRRLRLQLKMAKEELVKLRGTPDEQTGQQKESSSESAMARYAEMLKDPATKDVMRAQQKLALDMNYGSLFERMGLPPDGLEELKELLVDKQMAFMDMSSSMMATPRTSAEMKERAERVSAITEEYNDKIRLAIGEHYYEIYKQFEETLHDRMQVDVFKQFLSSNDRLTVRQEDDLIAAMYETRTDFYSSAQADKEQPVDPSRFTQEDLSRKLEELADLQDGYIARAQDILSEPQMEQFAKSMEQWRAMQESQIRMMWERYTELEQTDNTDGMAE